MAAGYLVPSRRLGLFRPSVFLGPDARFPALKTPGDAFSLFVPSPGFFPPLRPGRARPLLLSGPLSPPRRSSPPDRGNPDCLEACKARVSQIPNLFKKCPYEAVSRGPGGAASVSFTIAASGRGPGQSRASVAAFRTRMSWPWSALLPFPPDPARAEPGETNLTAPVSFRLD
jgi:hypothetical protein